MNNRERGRIAVLRKFPAHYKPPRLWASKERNIRYFAAREEIGLRYVDTLTNKQRDALNVLRIAPVGTYIEGIGIAWARSRSRWDRDRHGFRSEEEKVYVIDEIKEE